MRLNNRCSRFSIRLFISAGFILTNFDNQNFRSSITTTNEMIALEFYQFCMGGQACGYKSLSDRMAFKK